MIGYRLATAKYRVAQYIFRSAFTSVGEIDKEVEIDKEQDNEVETSGETEYYCNISFLASVNSKGCGSDGGGRGGGASILSHVVVVDFYVPDRAGTKFRVAYFIYLIHADGGGGGGGVLVLSRRPGGAIILYALTRDNSMYRGRTFGVGGRGLDRRPDGGGRRHRSVRQYSV
ncbi:hypothetical protein QTP88_012061 [Uroleucon formosanum]